jgi:hypothetical protein
MIWAAGRHRKDAHGQTMAGIVQDISAENLGAVLSREVTTHNAPSQILMEANLIDETMNVRN